MIDKQLNSLTPTKLRLVLIATIGILVVVAAVGFWLFRSYLIEYSGNVRAAAKEANVSSNDIANLQKLKTQLEDDKVAVTRTKNIVADSQSYQYQDQIINDLGVYAKSSGVVISAYNFTSDSATTTANSSSTGATAPQTASPTGLKSTSVSITLKNPVDYKSVIKFIHSIEANLTKMQLSGVSLTRADTKEQVTANPLTIEVYIR